MHFKKGPFFLFLLVLIPAVLPEMLKSLFKEFPKQSGSTHTIGLTWDGIC